MSADTQQVPSGLTDDELAGLDAHWRAANHLSVGQIHLMANPLLTEPLRPEHVKPRPLGPWGTSPGLNLVHTHLNRVSNARDLDALCGWGPATAGPPYWPTHGWRARTPRPTRTSPGTRPQWPGCSSSSRARRSSPASPRPSSTNSCAGTATTRSGTTTTPFDVVVGNDMDRYRLVVDVIDRVPGPAVRAAAVRQRTEDARLRHHDWNREHGVDLPEVADWSWDG